MHNHTRVSFQLNFIIVKLVFSFRNIISSVDVIDEEERIYLDIFDLERKTFISRETFFDGSEGIIQNYKCE